MPPPDPAQVREAMRYALKIAAYQAMHPDSSLLPEDGRAAEEIVAALTKWMGAVGRRAHAQGLAGLGPQTLWLVREVAHIYGTHLDDPTASTASLQEQLISCFEDAGFDVGEKILETAVVPASEITEAGGPVEMAYRAVAAAYERSPSTVRTIAASRYPAPRDQRSELQWPSDEECMTYVRDLFRSDDANVEGQSPAADPGRASTGDSSNSQSRNQGRAPVDWT